MSNNSTLPATGDVIAAEDIGGVKHQLVKVEFGAAGAATPVSIANPLPITPGPASNQWGQALAVTAGATATLATISGSTPGYQIKGLVAHGLGDGYFAIQVALITVLSGRIRSTLPSLSIVLPNGIAIATGSLVTLQVTNESASTTDFEATLLGS